MEDWINVEQIHDNNADGSTIIVNGALDKVRDGYYPAVFFPALAQTTKRFYAKPNKYKPCFIYALCPIREPMDGCIVSIPNHGK